MKTEIRYPVEFKKSERGQVLVVVVLVLIGLLAFTALAVDVGMLYFDRRQAQNGADAAALAGASSAVNAMDAAGVTYQNFSCGALTAINTAAAAASVQNALNNHYVIDNDPSDKNGVEVTCVSTWVAGGAYFERYLDVHVLLTVQTQTAFAQMFFPGALVNTVEAVSRVRPRTPMEFGYALAALGNNCEVNSNSAHPLGGLFFDGTAITQVSNGGILSNNCMDKNGTSGSVATAGTPPPGIYYRTNVSGDVGGFSPAPTHFTSPLPTFSVAPPNCGALPARGSTNGGGTLQPGRYTSMDIKNDTLLAPGLYCLTGDLTDNNRSLQVVPVGQIGRPGVTVTANDGVTFYLSAGDVKITGGTINLKAPLVTTDPTGALKGMLIYSAVDHGQVTLVGNAGSVFQGTVFAPLGLLEFGGNTAISYATQMIGAAVKVHGSTNLTVDYQNQFDWSRLPMLNLEK